MVLDGEIAVPDDRGVTPLDGLSEAIADHQPAVAARLFRVRSVASRRPRFRRCPIEDPKMLLRDLIGAARCERIVYVDHVLGIGKELFEGRARDRGRRLEAAGQLVSRWREPGMAEDQMLRDRRVRGPRLQRTWGGGACP